MGFKASDAREPDQKDVPHACRLRLILGVDQNAIETDA
jgi:hypothetical protein